jgi:cytochrome c-type biogenesis protein CcmH/NrfG
MTVCAAILLLTALQAPASDRARAEALARQGQTVEAIDLFKQIVQANPADVEARLWVARLALRLGRTDEAQAGFRSVLNEHPDDVDARIGLGMALTRAGAWREALEVLQAAEPAAGNNADLFSALARAYRRAGNDERALEYFTRAKALAPDDPDVALGYEAVARTYGHWIAAEGFGQTGAARNVGSGSIAVDVRAHPRLHLQADGRVQSGPAYSDAIGGGGALWHAWRATTVSFRAAGGSNNVALPTSDVSGEVLRYGALFDAGVGIRRLTFAGVRLVAVSPVWAWIPNDAWRLDARYTYSRSTFDVTGQSEGDHSMVLRPTWQGWRRVALQATYAYGIESFEELTLDRVASLGATTAAAGVRVDLRSLTRITAIWEHQWRSNETQIDRVTASVVQTIR